MKNWRTTLIGAVGAAVQGAVGVAQVSDDNAAGWTNVLMAALFALLGFVAKDAGVTGPGA